ncbi:MAG: DUF4349 domain-containing protein, partial [Chloroflexi bacterium]|nr:DUF4349 domain-containing protein [Chloroflexota bacterium]
MPKVVIFLLVALAVALVACAGGQEALTVSEESMSQSGFDTGGATEAFASPAVESAAQVIVREIEVEKAISDEGRGERGGFNTGGQSLQTAQRKVISTASISLEVEEVESTIKQVQAVVEGMGGFVENLSSSGGSRSGEQYANMTLRVPQDRFLAAVEAVENLGVVLNRNLGSEDVSERFIDLEARLKSSLREEQSLLSLLGRTSTVSEILTIERELARIRADVERFQGQLNFLERRVDLATIHLSMVPPQGSGGEPPSAILRIEVAMVGQEVDSIKALVASVGGSVDRVFLSLRDGQERADISLRVFSKDFSKTIAFLEQTGDVKTKEITEEKTGTEDEARPSPRPDATIQVFFIGEGEGISVRRVALIVAIIGGVLLVLVVVFLVFNAIRDGRFSRG